MICYWFAQVLLKINAWVLIILKDEVCIRCKNDSSLFTFLIFQSSHFRLILKAFQHLSLYLEKLKRYLFSKSSCRKWSLILSKDVFQHPQNDVYFPFRNQIKFCSKRSLNKYVFSINWSSSFMNGIFRNSNSVFQFSILKQEDASKLEHFIQLIFVFKRLPSSFVLIYKIFSKIFSKIFCWNLFYKIIIYLHSNWFVT